MSYRNLLADSECNVSIVVGTLKLNNVGFLTIAAVLMSISRQVQLHSVTVVDILPLYRSSQQCKISTCWYKEAGKEVMFCN